MVAKYVALTVPSMMPSRQIRELPQSGHQRRRAAAFAPFVAACRGAKARTATAMTATGTLQNAKPHCQLPPTIGKTSGNISATGANSPISKPLV